MGLKIAMAIFLSLLTLELGLQVASWIAQARQESRAPTTAAGDEIVILCVGDSHTWGAGVDPDSNYPAQLQRALSRNRPDRRFRVVNLGVPGVNSAYVALRLEDQIVELRPSLVIVWVGANNFWNELEVEGDDDLDGSKLHRWLLHSKLYRLATVFRHVQPDSYEGEAKRDPQKPARRRAYLDWRREGKRSSSERRERRLFADMSRMVETVAAFATPILFLTYPQDPEAPVSKLIGRFAGDLGVRAIVTSRDRRRALSDGLRMPQLFVSAAGPHPSPELYRYIVDSLQGPVVELIGLAPPGSR